MAIEQLITDLITALNENTAALLSGTTATAPTDKVSADKPAKTGKSAKVEADDKPKHTQEQVNAALIKIKDDFGIEPARTIFKKYKYDKMGDIKPQHFDAIFAEAEKVHAELSAVADSTEEDADNGL